MPVSKISLLALLLLLCKYSIAQVVDNAATFKNIQSGGYFRFHYDNDFFTARDDYYTQGITLEWVQPFWQKNPLNKLLLKPAHGTAKYGIRVDHFGYTPTSIRSEDILYGDRPFSSNLSLASFAITSDTLRQRRISSAFTVGIIGPSAGNEAMQKAIHRWLDNIPPLGWQHQIRNDLILNYQIDYEQSLLVAHNWLLVNLRAQLNAGTHSNRVKAGLNVMLGNFDDPYRAQAPAKKWRYYLYAQAQPAFTIYDATLQGGLFNRNSPYTLTAEELNRLTLQGDFGLVLSIGNLHLEYCQAFITKEFKTGQLHRWGGIRIGASF